jgi:hypothetical protein
MLVKKTLTNQNSDKLCWRNGAPNLGSTLLLVLLVTIAVACQPASSASLTEQWTPSYLQLRLSAGEARLQLPGDSKWITLEKEAIITIEETGQIVADAVEGVQFSVGNDSILELSPGTEVELQNLRTFARLQVTLRDGNLLFVAREPSYEFLVSDYSVSLLSIPSQVEIEVNGDTVRVGIEEGAVACTTEEETFTVSVCREIFLSPGQEPQITDSCIAVAETPPTFTSSMAPSSTPGQAEETMTPSPSPSLTTTPTPSQTLSTPTPSQTLSTPTPSQTPKSTSTREIEVAPPTQTPVPPTETPAPPPSKKKSPTQPPPTQPPPTQPPPTQPPPTQPPPTQPPPTQPPPTRVPPTEPRPTLPSPSEPEPTTSPE